MKIEQPVTQRIHDLIAKAIMSDKHIIPTDIWVGPEEKQALTEEVALSFNFCRHRPIRITDFKDGGLQFASPLTGDYLTVRFMEKDGLRVGVSMGES